MAGILDGVGHGEDNVRNGSSNWIHKSKAAIVECDLIDALGVGRGRLRGGGYRRRFL